MISLRDDIISGASALVFILDKVEYSVAAVARADLVRPVKLRN